MTPDGFRKLALELPEAVENSHFAHPDFRVRGKIFATLGFPDATMGAVMLTPEQQDAFVQTSPDIFVPVKGGWGLKGATNVRLKAATAKALRPALATAWRKIAPKSLSLEPAEEASPPKGRRRG
jgi:hypothetical protein